VTAAGRDRHNTVRLLISSGALALAIAGLTRAGHGLLAAPPLTEPDRIGAWLASRRPDVAVISLLRLVSLGLAWYLAATVALGVAARLVHVAWLVQGCDLVTLPSIRRLVGPVVGISLATVPLGGPNSAWADPASRSPTTTIRPPAPTMRWLPPDMPPPAAHRATAANQPPPVSQPRAATGGTWTVRHGDHFWGIATRVLAFAWSREPSPSEAVPYWEVLVESNRARLGERDNPSLIFPGQTFVVPTPPPPP
jgi:hypothetical protein